MSQARMAKERSEETKEKRAESLLVRRSCAAECRDFALRDWTEHSSAGIAKIEACTCPSRKGRVCYASSRSSYPPLFLFPFFLFVLTAPVLFAFETSLHFSSFAFLLLGFVSEIRSMSFSPRPFCHAFLSLPFVFFWAEL